MEVDRIYDIHIGDWSLISKRYCISKLLFEIAISQYKSNYETVI